MTFSSAEFLPEKLKDGELYQKAASMVDYIVNNALVELEDVKYKYRGPDIVREEVIKEIIKELGFQYIVDVMDTLDNFQFNALLEFVSLINLLKGSRQGLELILKLLGFNIILSEWWEQFPPAAAHTYNMTVVMNTSYVPNPVDTLNKVQVFASHYVFPVVDHIDYRFTLTFAEKNATVAGFWKAKYVGEAVATL